ncbi:MAG TPA: thiamine pyrophosphate-binding protein [Candidatus Koribacter sp.]
MSSPFISPTKNIASYAVDLVTALGSHKVFSLTGGMAMHLNRAVAQHGVLKPVYCQHEQACVAAAEGYAKAADFRRAGFAVITAGPGVSNSVTSLISAYGDSTPLIVLAGQIKTDDIDRFGTRTHGIQEIRSREVITPCVKRFVRLDAESYRRELVETLAEAFAGRPGPVFIEIPLDVQGMPIDYSVEDIEQAVEAIRHRTDDATHSAKSKKALAQCIAELLMANRPLLYVGNGCRIAGVEETVREFLHKHAMPAVFSWLSFDIVSSHDRCYFGCPGGLAPIYANEVLARADHILFLGARLDLGTTAFQRELFGSQAKRVFVDIDPHELKKFEGFANSKSVEADLHALPEAIVENGEAKSAAEATWLPWCEERKAAYLPEERERLRSDKMTVYGIAEALSRWSDGKVFVPASSGYAEETFSRFFAPGEGTRFFNGAALGSMGLGLPHSIGASFGSDRRVMGLEADGGLMLNVQELATLSHYAPKGFVLFVLNNHGYESIRASQTRYFGQVSGVDTQTGLFIPDLDKLAAAFKLRYTCVKSLEDLDSLLPSLGPNDPPIVVDLHIERFENRGPSVKTKIGEDGKPYTTPLAELSW